MEHIPGSKDHLLSVYVIFTNYGMQDGTEVTNLRTCEVTPREHDSKMVHRGKTRQVINYYLNNSCVLYILTKLQKIDIRPYYFGPAL